MDEILLPLKDTSPTSCNNFIHIHISLSDKFIGGYPLHYWMMLISSKWIMRVVSDANKVLGRQ